MNRLNSHLSRNRHRHVNLTHIFLHGTSLILFSRPADHLSTLGRTVVLHSVRTVTINRRRTSGRHNTTIILISRHRSTVHVTSTMLGLWLPMAAQRSRHVTLHCHITLQFLTNNNSTVSNYRYITTFILQCIVQRHDGTTVRYSITAQRHDSTVAQRRNGVTVRWHGTTFAP